MSKTLDKRNSLELFLREQLIGPGINGYRYVDLEDAVTTGKRLLSESAIHYTNEILDIVPAAIYSTGILFPRDNSNTGSDGIALDNNEQFEKNDEADEEDFQNSSEDDVEAIETVELNQMFPKTMGLTFCVDETALTDGGVEFNVNARYYKKLKQDKDGKFNNRYGLLCEVNKEDLKKFLTENNLDKFTLRDINDNCFLLLSKLTSEDVKLLKTKILARKKIASEQLFEKTIKILSIPHLTKENCYLSNLKSSIYYELKNSITSEATRANIYSITQEIELIENITDHLKNLLDVNSGGYGLWQAEQVQRVIKIDNIEFLKSQNKITYLHNDPEGHSDHLKVIDNDGNETKGLMHIFRNDLEKKDDFASLSANIQLSRDSRKNNSKIFIKVQLINTSIPFDETKQNDNRYYSTFNELVNQKSFFGVNVSISNKWLVAYTDYNYFPNNGVYDEDETTKFVYDQFKDFAIGHGCSVKWNISALGKKVETEYLPVCQTPDIEPIPRDKSRFPIFDDKEDFFTAPLFLEDAKAQEFKWLSIFSDASDEDVVKGLISFIESYGSWIDAKRKQPRYKNQFKDIAEQELDKCERDYLRMKENIVTFLSGNNNVDRLNSFRLMNSAMFMQLWHSIKTKNNQVSAICEQESFTTFDFNFYRQYTDDKLFSDKSSASWRAFQLAFILLNLDGIFKAENDLLWEYRNDYVDLVWFPTGGGKTEAYLGLIALTIINRRRLFGKKGGGTAAIMRYTLRLLTMQQFQRATLVIMALELIRKWDLYEFLGEEPITIGLWVGKNSIPNSNVELIYEYEHKLNLKKENKIPFNSCPWCNSEVKGEIKDDNDETTSVFNKNRVHLKCSNNKCSFSFGTGRISKKRSDQGPIPVCLSDETIYQHPPSLLFGTVDKFAQLAHKVNGTNTGRNADSRRIFGRGNWEAGKPSDGYLPPDLIIQDELHLLLGPLGSAVALYESAINQLCTRKDGTRPKIISSTATTRNTKLQIMALFDRKVNLFPKPGVECDDSFFAFYKRKYSTQEKENEEFISNRKYIGVLPTGRTQIWMQMRLAAIIMTHRAIFEIKELNDKSPIDFRYYDSFKEAMNYYHTTISYFNSLKEVGKTQSQVQSYILKELRRVFSRAIRPQKLMHCFYTYGPIHESELTGRLSGEEVKNELKNVETRWDAKKRFASIENGEVLKGKIPPEFVVATNMISVGIDVSRFNTIIMNSMPRNTAEYIQASSRVARNDYGLVLTVHHPFRARDISHYEKFIEFHEKMYSYVEPISITPFTRKAVERYMGLYLATMIRHMTKFVERESAENISTISDTELNQIIQELTKYFDERKDRLAEFDTIIRNLIKDENVNQIKKWIQEAFNEWKAESNRLIADENKQLVFSNKSAKSKRHQEQLYVDIEEYDNQIHSKKWQIPMSLRVIEPEAAIKINPL